MGTCDMSQEVFDRISTMEYYFGASKRYNNLVKESIAAFERGQMREANRVLDRLPSEHQLLTELTEKLKSKSVYKTLKRIAKGEETSVFETMKGYFSLGTHIAVECERGNTEYTLLLTMIHNRLGNLIYTGEEQE